MKYLCIYCEVLEEYIMSAYKGAPFECIFDKIPKDMHTNPVLLNKELKKRLSAADKIPTTPNADGIDGVILGIALCGGALEGIFSLNHRLIIPKAHDCISFFLGSGKRYNELFYKYGGKAFWFTTSFLKQDYLPTKKHFSKLKSEYIEKFDEESADYLIETEIDSLSQYKYIVKIDNLDKPDIELAKAAKECESEYGWKLCEFSTDLSLFNAILNGNWNEEDFLIVPAGKTVIKTNDKNIISYR